MTKQLEREAKRIEDAIVTLVKRKGGATFAQIEREVAGFASGKLGWQYSIEWEDGIETVIWQNLTSPGLAALKAVLSGRRVAVELVHPLLYLLQGRLPECEHWLPMRLRPAEDANLDGPRWLMWAPQDHLDALAQTPAAERRYRMLDPRSQAAA
jgi:hypothetical protein